MSQSTNNFNFTCEYIPSSNSVFYFPEPVCEQNLILGEANAYTGFAALFDIVDSNDTYVYTGFTAVADLEVEAIPFLFHAYVGTSAVSNLTKSALFDGVAHTGFGSSGILTTLATPTFSATALTGQEVVTDIQTFKNLDAVVNVGFETFADLKALPIQTFDAIAHTGFEMVAVLTGSTFFDAIAHTGVDTYSSLRTYPSDGFSILPAQVGIESSAVISLETKLSANWFVGNEVKINLFRDRELAANAHTGTLTSFRFADTAENPFLGTNFLGYAGFNSLSSLVITDHVTLRNINAHVGIEAKAAVKTFESFSLGLINGWHGITSDIKVSITQVLSADAFYGNTFLMNGDFILDDSGFYRAFTGIDTKFNMQTESMVSASAWTGERMNVIFTDVPPVRLEAKGEIGFHSFSEMWHLYSPNIVPYRIKTAVWVDAMLDPVTTHASLCITCDEMPIRHENFEINLNSYNDQRIYYSNDVRVKVTASLQTNPQLTFEPAATGFSSSVRVLGSNDETILSESIIMANGIGVKDVELFVDFKTNQQVGVDNPDPDNIDIELNIEEKSDWYVNVAYNGIGLEKFTLSAYKNFYPKSAWTGEYTVGTLTIEERMRAIIWVDPEAKFTLWTQVAIYPRAYTGISAKATFLEPDWMASVGIWSEASLTMEYGVMFGENGCVDNEYLFDDGSTIDKWRTTKAAVELEPFRYKIKGKCY